MNLWHSSISQSKRFRIFTGYFLSYTIDGSTFQMNSIVALVPVLKYQSKMRIQLNGLTRLMYVDKWKNGSEDISSNILKC